MIGVYLRVSTKEQNTSGQRSEIERYLKNNGFSTDSTTWYEDQESGVSLKRPAFERLQADIFNGLIKTVVVWKLDRLSRRLRDGVNLLADWTDKDVRIIVITQQLDLSGVIGRTIAALMLGLAEIELGHMKERQRAGIDAAKVRGAYSGSKPGRRTASPARAKQLAAKGNTAPEIAAALKISRRTVLRYLSQP
jgi:DNA invertase Pin-like site-specific DNA recombinase